MADKNSYTKTAACLILMAAALTCFAFQALGGERIVWDMDSGADDFSLERPAISISQAPAADAAVSGKSLRINGRFTGGSSYLTSSARELHGFNQYRISASLKIDTISTTEPSQKKTLPLPYIKLVCMNGDGNPLGTFDLRPDMSKNGRWQTLSQEFRAPWTTEQCRVLIADDFEKLVNPEFFAEADFSIDDIVIEQIPFFTRNYSDVLNPLPEIMSDKRGVHPRLYLTSESIGELKTAVNGTHKTLWLMVKKQADSLLGQKPPEWRGNNEGEWDEQWWMSGNGRSMITLAMTYLLTGEEKYLDGAEKWARVTCEYPGWGIGWAANIDCMTGHNLFGLALVYDWLYEDLDSETKALIRRTMIERAAYMYGSASKGTIVPGVDYFRERPWPEWEDAWLQNHLWVNSTGLLAAGLALYDETDSALAWAGFAQEKFVRSLSYFGPDGASHEGINYWSYGVEHLLKSMYLLRDNAGVDLFNTPWLAQTSLYRFYCSIPGNDWQRGSTTVNYSDSHPRDNSGPGHMLRALAAVYRDSHAQYFAEEIDNAGVSNLGDCWLNLIWYDPSVPETTLDDLPTFKHFRDMDFVSARSGWSGDESYLFYKCGPYLGHYASAGMNYDASSAHHLHPDQNSFMLHGAGEWLMRDDGNYGKYTGQHNTLIIDGGEQLGGGDSIFDGSILHAEQRKPQVLTAETSPAFDHIAGEASAAYPSENGLTRFTRHLLYIKPDVLIVADDIVLDSEHDLELRFHPGPQEAVREGNVFYTRTEKSTLRIEPLTADGLGMEAAMHDLIDRRYNVSTMLSVSLRKHGSAWRNAVALSWAEKGSEPAQVVLEKAGERWTFKKGTTEIVLDWGTGSASLSK